jgi:hypothetical protein
VLKGDSCGKADGSEFWIVVDYFALLGMLKPWFWGTEQP